MEILGYRQKLQVAATSGNGTAIQTGGWTRENTLYITGTASVSAGAIQPETADESTYAGTWAPLGGEIAVSTGTQIFQVTGAIRALRARISSNVAGGTVTVMAVGN
jgi:hypothetical protein